LRVFCCLRLGFGSDCHHPVNFHWQSMVGKSGSIDAGLINFKLFLVDNPLPLIKRVA